MKISINKIAILIIFSFHLSNSSFSQSTGEFKPDKGAYGLKKLDDAPKKIYIANFNINFEVYKEATDFKRGGSTFGGGEKSSAQASAAIGLNGVDFDAIQKKANLLYTEFVENLKAKGYEIISPEDAGKTEVYEGWVKVMGPSVHESGLPGVITATPENYSFYYRGEKANGKQKKSIFGNNLVFPSLSSQLKDAVIADVNLYFMFSENGNDWMSGNAAKVKLFTNYRLVDEYVVSAPKTGGIVKLKGAQSYENIASSVNFNQGKQGMGSPVMYTGTLKKPLEIDGVIAKEKVVAYQKQGSSTPTSFSGVSWTDTADKFSKNAKWLEVDGKLYADGIYNAGKQMLDFHTKAFLDNL